MYVCVTPVLTIRIIRKHFLSFRKAIMREKGQDGMNNWIVRTRTEICATFHASLKLCI